MNLQEILTYPYDNSLILRKQKSIRRELIERKSVDYTPIRIAILAGSTVDDIKNILELFLLERGIKPSFYLSEYNKFYEDAVFGNAELDAFQPEIVIVFTSCVNIANMPDIDDDGYAAIEKADAETKRFKEIWKGLNERYNAVIIQNNFDYPAESSLGSLSAVLKNGSHRFVSMLNERFAAYAESHKNFYINDICGLAARIGLNKWHNPAQYFTYKFAMDYDVIPDVSLGLAIVIRAVLGKIKKCLVLDLDNTLWGGVIGDDGVNNIKIGHETPEGEAYTVFQKYVLGLKKRGILIAVCSKNDENIAKSGFNHPDSVLHVDDFVAFYANWSPKNENIKAISEELNIGLDSFVFIDDNPVERHLVRDTLPEVAVPEIDPDDVFSYIRAIEGAGYFEPIFISEDDRKRNDAYRGNAKRQMLQKSSTNYEDFLKSLSMTAEIDAFSPVYFDRIAQLTGKTNQFNLTTRRYTRAEIESMANDSHYITLYGRLADKFGDNGLVSVIIAEKRGVELHILLWLMSCRVLKRGMEDVMLDELAKRAIAAGCSKLIGYYYPTKKNMMVEKMYEKFGFAFAGNDENGTVWEMEPTEYKKRGKFIATKGMAR